MSSVSVCLGSGNLSCRPAHRQHCHIATLATSAPWSRRSLYKYRRGWPHSNQLMRLVSDHCWDSPPSTARIKSFIIGRKKIMRFPQKEAERQRGKKPVTRILDIYLILDTSNYLSCKQTFANTEVSQRRPLPQGLFLVESSYYCFHLLESIKILC